MAPDEPDYAQAFARHNPSLRAAWVFTAGGIAMETVAVVVVSGGLHLAGAWQLAVLVLAVSTVLLLAYAVIDVITSTRLRRPCGAVSALWAMAPRSSVVLLAVALGLRVQIAVAVAGSPG